jgi:hypothetical protein
MARIACAAALFIVLSSALGIVTAQAYPEETNPLICIVIRTYWAHGTYGDSSLMGLLHSFRKQTYQK